MIAVTRYTPVGKQQTCVILPEIEGVKPTQVVFCELERVPPGAFLVRETELPLRVWEANVDEACRLLEEAETLMSGTETTGSNLAV